MLKHSIALKVFLELVEFSNKVVITQALAIMLKQWDGHRSEGN